MAEGEGLFGSGSDGYTDFRDYLEGLVESKPNRIAEAEALRQQRIARQRAHEEESQAQQGPTPEELEAQRLAASAAAREREKRLARATAVTNAAKATAHFLSERGATPDHRIQLVRSARRLGSWSVGLWLVNYHEDTRDEHHPDPPILSSGEPNVTSALADSRALARAGTLKKVTASAHGLGLDDRGVLYDVDGSGEADKDGVFKSMAEVAKSRLRLEADPYNFERLASRLSDESVVYWQQDLAELADSYI